MSVTVEISRRYPPDNDDLPVGVKIRVVPRFANKLSLRFYQYTPKGKRRCVFRKSYLLPENTVLEYTEKLKALLVRPDESEIILDFWKLLGKAIANELTPDKCSPMKINIPLSHETPAGGVFSEIELVIWALKDYGQKKIEKLFEEPEEYDPMPDFIRSTMDDIEWLNHAALGLKIDGILLQKEISEEIEPLSFCLQPEDDESGQVKVLYLALQEFRQAMGKRFADDRSSGELTEERAGYYQKQREMIADLLQRLATGTIKAGVPLPEILKQ